MDEGSQAAIIGIVAAIVLKVFDAALDWYRPTAKRDTNKERREERRDLFDEVTELWKRLDLLEKQNEAERAENEILREENKQANKRIEELETKLNEAYKRIEELEAQSSVKQDKDHE